MSEIKIGGFSCHQRDDSVIICHFTDSKRESVEG
jgi:hypothetical protein